MFGSDAQLQCTEDCIHTAPTHMCNKEKCHTCNPAKLWHLVFEKLPHDCTTTRAIIYRRRQRGEDLQIRAARQIAQTSCDVLVCPVPSSCQGCCWYGLCPIGRTQSLLTIANRISREAQKRPPKNMMDLHFEALLCAVSK